MLHFTPISMCVLGRRLLKDIEIDNCTKEVDGTLWKEYCDLKNNTHDRDFTRNPEIYRGREKNWECDPYFQGLSFRLNYLQTSASLQTERKAKRMWNNYAVNNSICFHLTSIFLRRHPINVEKNKNFSFLLFV